MDLIPPGLLSFSVKADNVKIIKTPSHFYQILLDHTRKAKKRIYLSSLYLGDGQLENDLVDVLESRASEHVDVSVLIDFLRGTRGADNGSSSSTLLKKIADHAKIYLFHSPQLHGLLKYALPERTNEIVGLQHMKLYIFDDSVILSGANLSHSYFTDRQDRYILFSNCPELADFFCSIIDVIGSNSFVLHGDGSIVLDERAISHPYQGNPQEYVEGVRAAVLSVVEASRSASRPSDGDTVVCPILQMGPFHINEEYDLLRKMFASQDENMHVTLASGYFNCIEEYERILVDQGRFPIDILMAAPDSNGFAGASGLSKHVPALYSWVATRFLDDLARKGRTKARLYEFSRPNWSFHAKGIWFEKGGEVATIVGSSNYGYRSVHRDLEAQVMLATRNQSLVQRLKEEHECLFEFASPLDVSVLRRADHHVPRFISLIARFIRHYF